MNLLNKAFAQTGQDTASEVVQTVATKAGFDIGNILTWAIGIGAVMALVVIMWGGILWSTSEIAHKKAEAQEWIKGAIYGLLLLLGAYLILNTINPEILQF